jgi:hypothetical protein
LVAAFGYIKPRKAVKVLGKDKERLRHVVIICAFTRQCVKYAIDAKGATHE